MRFFKLPILLAALLLGSVETAHAQEPKPGRDWYEDAVDVGFTFKAPDGWGFVPAQPGEVGTVGRYVAPTGQLMVHPQGKGAWEYACFILIFDRRKVDDAEGGKAEGKRTRSGPADVTEWVEGNLSITLHKVSEKPARMGKLDTVEYLFEGQLGGDYPVNLGFTLFKLQPDLEVALGFNGPGGNKWSKFERAAGKICKTLQIIEVKTDRANAALSNSLRDLKRAELQAEAAKNPGWELYETPNYFVFSSNSDRAFMKELLDRLEAVRSVYEVTYPPSLAKELRSNALAKKRAAEAAAGKEETQDDGAEEPEEEDPDEGRSVSSRADPMELSRTSVVRVCKDRGEYSSYGGPGGSAGYWSPMQRELVVYDAKAVGGRDDTWATMNHEAFHQYIFYFFGSLAPHYWYNEGTGDFYGGYEYKNKKFTLKPFDWRERTIQQAIRSGIHFPLQEFVRFDRAKYYGEEIGQNYAQGWALIWFLRTGKQHARGWDDSWDSILSTYLRVLVETDDLDTAVDAAFAGVDWKAFEDCWKAYILK